MTLDKNLDLPKGIKNTGNSKYMVTYKIHFLIFNSF